MRPSFTPAFLLSIATLATSQCPDPPTPVNGFTVKWDYDQVVTLSDGYKTRADVFFPTTAPGRCGWPVALSVHGGPSPNGKLGLRNENYALARRGFLAVGYDVRGQGLSHSLNPGKGTTLMGLDEWIDMFEVIEWVLKTYAGRADPKRVGVYGTSQGGWHTWAAAAYSDKMPPPNKRRSMRFPTVHAAVTRYINPSFHDSEIPYGTMFKSVLVSIAYYNGQGGWTFDASVQSTFRKYIDLLDPAGLRSWIRNDPGRDFLKELTTTNVPVFAILSWHDYHAAPNRALDTFRMMPKTTPRRIYLDTGGHGSPVNDYQASMRPILTRQWLRRFLKGWSEPVEAGPPVILASIPGKASAYAERSSLWRHRADASLPAANVKPTQLFLRTGGRLLSAPPTSNEPADTIAHRAPATYTMQRYNQDGAGFNPAAVARSIPLQRVSYRTDAFGHDVEVSGVPDVTLELTSNHANFLVAAQLYARPPQGSPQLLSSGARGVRGKSGAQQVRVEMDVLNTIVKAGWTLELFVQNYLVVRIGNGQVVRYVPSFHNYDLRIEHRPAAISVLSLPVRPSVRPDVSTPTTSVLTTLPLPVKLTVQSSPGRAGNPYLLLCSLSGQRPLPLPNGPLWLSWDPLTSVFLASVNTPMLQGFLGLLDAQGTASATLDLAPVAAALPPVAYSNLHIAPVVLGTNELTAGGPLFIEFR